MADARPVGLAGAAALVAACGLGMVALSCASSGSKSSSQGESGRYLRLAYVQMERGETKEALDSTRQALSRDPNNAEAHNFMGLIYLSFSEYQEAVDHLREAVQLNAYFTDAHNNLGVAYLQLKQYDKAMKEFQTALNDRTYKTPEKVQLNLGNLYLDQGVMSEAVRCYERAVALNPSYLNGYIGLGTAYQKSGRADLAAEQFRKVMSLAPDSKEAVRAKTLLDGAGTRSGS
ncbi:MAG TPA: tetratricopeptide repeat protein [Candidatus Cryosericum sp.]|nr:tetratricopeptide repeat protein [Candidatus Cryosericum sp.]